MTKEIELTQGKVTIVDDSDYEWLSQWKWYALRRRKTDSFYAVRKVRIDGNYRTILMHREILGLPDDMFPDHINGDSLNNTRLNLRSATIRQNNCNVGKLSNNTSGFKGIWCYSAAGQDRWGAQIKVNGVKKWLGAFSTPVGAACAYDVAAIEFHGEFARLNFGQSFSNES